MPLQIDTMTINQLTNELRELGIRTSNQKTRAAIKQGKYPFAIHVKMENDEFEIYRKLFDKWVEERAIEKE